MAAADQMAGAQAKLLGLLRLADGRSNGFPGERRVALDKAAAIAGRCGIALEDIIADHGIDVSDLCPGPPSREEIVGAYPVAGFRYYEGPANRRRMRAGDPVSLLREIGNPYDKFAVMVDWNGLDIGHIPRGMNVAIWQRLRARLPLEARIASIDAAPHGTVEIEIR